ncbi:hypothetical protein NBE98_02675 [Clostridium swellfunianum]|uniref:hypothetical protein n=1 Tax=Clostridium swellfunianum TaxID=1367462 RepID=UPI002030252A|nr:hypothetical protein [Clostridium swellfunianum]MCM0647278.1 hypothetical protein [Clostridium swellfunianum]
MKKKVLVIVTTAILTIGAVTAVYAKENNNPNNLGFGRGTMYQDNINNDTYKQMTNLMRKNDFEDAAKAMENRDFNSMNNFMNNITDDQYNQMIDIMKNNGYEGMAKMMGSVSRQEMVNIHNSMMGR